MKVKPHRVTKRTRDRDGAIGQWQGFEAEVSEFAGEHRLGPFFASDDDVDLLVLADHGCDANRDWQDAKRNTPGAGRLAG